MVPKEIFKKNNESYKNAGFLHIKVLAKNNLAKIQNYAHDDPGKNPRTFSLEDPWEKYLKKSQKMVLKEFFKNPRIFQKSRKF